MLGSSLTSQELASCQEEALLSCERWFEAVPEHVFHHVAMPGWAWERTGVAILVEDCGGYDERPGDCYAVHALWIT